MAEPIDNDLKKKTGFVRKKSADNLLLDMGKLPPQARELEEAVLGAMMLEGAVVDEIIGILQVESFYVDAHQRIYAAIKELYNHNSPVDLLTVTEQLRKNGDLDKVGGAYFIAQLTNKIGSSAHAEYHARIIAEKYIQRMLISSSNTILKEAYEDSADVFELLDKAETNLMQISELNSKKASLDIASILHQELKEIDTRM